MGCRIDYNLFKVHFCGSIFGTLIQVTQLHHSFNTSRLMASQLVERHLNYNRTFQVPLRQFTSLDIKPDLFGHIKLPLRNFIALTAAQERYLHGTAVIQTIIPISAR